MIVTLDSSHERELRRWLLKHDMDFATHRILRDYFLAPTTHFGTVACRDERGWIQAICFFSLFEKKVFFHHYFGRLTDLEDVRLHFAVPCQAFFRATHTPPADSGWKKVLSVVPGFTVDHPAYSGVFNRTTPGYEGGVYEHD